MPEHSCRARSGSQDCSVLRRQGRTAPLTWQRLMIPAQCFYLCPRYLTKFVPHETPDSDDSSLHPRVNLICAVLFLVLFKDAFLARIHGPKETGNLICQTRCAAVTSYVSVLPKLARE